MPIEASGVATRSHVRHDVIGWRVVLLVGVAAEIALLGAGVTGRWPDRLLRLEVLSGAAFLVAVVALSRAGLVRRTAFFLVLSVAALLQVAALRSPPIASDDVHRYIWDAKVQLAGIDPYRYSPADPALAPQRAAPLFPPRGGCSWTLPDGSCSTLNRPTVRTVYPPVAEAAFTAVRLLSGARIDGPFPLQVAGAIGMLAVCVLLISNCRRRGLAPWTVAVWAWCPVAALELTNNAHIDWLAVLLGISALMAASARRPGRAAVLIGAAVATKLYPGLLVPSLLRHRPRVVIGAALVTVAVSYLPHVASVGTNVIGYLPGYLREEDYLDGRRFLVLRMVIPPVLLPAVAALLLAVVLVLAARRTSASAPENTAVVTVGTALLISTPGYSWYGVLLLALVAMTSRLEWLPLVFAPGLAAFGATDFGAGFRTGSYVAALVLLLLGVLLRARRSETRAAPAAGPAPIHRPIRLRQSGTETMAATAPPTTDD